MTDLLRLKHLSLTEAIDPLLIELRLNPKLELRPSPLSSSELKMRAKYLETNEAPDSSVFRLDLERRTERQNCPEYMEILPEFEPP
jgi:hypothetical protein